MKKTINILGCIFAILIISISCKKDWLDTAPTDQLASGSLFKDLGAIKATIIGLNRYRFAHNELDVHQYSVGDWTYNLQCDALAGDFTETADDYFTMWGTQLELHWTMADSRLVSVCWRHPYKQIANANVIIDGLNQLTSASAEKDYLMAQALIYRAYYYHRLVQVYAKPISMTPDAPGVPLQLKGNSLEMLPRSTVAQVYDQILTDLGIAEALLTGNATPRDNKTFADLSVVKGLYARVYSCMHNWNKVKEYAAEARVGYPIMSKEDWQNGFFVSNAEWMWQSSCMSKEENNYVAAIPAFICNYDGYPQAWGFAVCISKQLIDHVSSSDVRAHGRSTQTDSLIVDEKTPSSYDRSQYYYNKFTIKDPTGEKYDLVHMRASEMLLLEAEADLELNNEAGARILLKELLAKRCDDSEAYINAIPNGIAKVMSELKIQRRLELWCEGFAYLDLKRRETGLTGEDNAFKTNGQMDAKNGRAATADIPVTDGWFTWLIPASAVNYNTLLEQNTY
ncbi:MAG: RagB/SusD family nutrient uptake outer membrane protein [Bacteroidales bacterium]|nr:RagB/SusD family nutrient uptake outer membrane protein [Bacteroidales bacterium]